MANSVFANGVVVLRTMTEGLSPAVENKHIIFMNKFKNQKRLFPSFDIIYEDKRLLEAICNELECLLPTIIFTT